MAGCISEGVCSLEEESDNLEQQRNEVEMLQSIFDQEISILKENTEYLVEVVPHCDGNVRVSLQHLTSGIIDKRVPQFISVSHVPVVTLYIKYPQTYPSHQPPDFHISAWWLDPKSDSFTRDQLLHIFAQDCLVVYDWILYIQNDLIKEYSHFQTKSTDVGEVLNPPEISSKETVRHPCQIFLRSSSQLNDMEEYDCYENHKDFQQSRHECVVCVRSFVGADMCPPCDACGLVCCKQCTVDYCKVCVTEGHVRTILCPGQQCSEALSDAFLEEILHKDLFKRYVDLREQAELDSIPGMVFCPRLKCGTRVISEQDSNLAQCTQCGFPFCKLCKQTWHGPGTCPAIEKFIAANNKAETSEATDSDNTKLSQTDKKRVEDLKSLIWIRASDNVKPCPKCSVNIQKSGGCNKMHCQYCRTKFCWLCEKVIIGYEHFDGVTCRVFRDEDYLPPEDTAPKEVIVPDDDTLEQTLDRALMSVCPRCGRSESKNTNDNWIHCRHCKFQYCHICREPCFGAWHFSEEYGCKRRTTVREDLASVDIETS